MSKIIRVAAPQDLSADELRMAMLFRAMDQRRKGEISFYAEAQAKAHPHRVAPVLRIVSASSA
jgi:hypothetical protein